ncbi:cytochrome P450 [Lepidopterella palustris CBS 459.81]|uniref:Cytochrome P450 n=1 Tax=Lepidopterella palustris CBS 459.81 TaxID=1314670 RepID=A0A8E2E4G7_9PEZI|nr:cytochrome P450 [Lepidopterella palustris CBS 459.81]
MDAVEPTPSLMAAVSAGFIGLVSHQIFRKNEPTVKGFVGHVVIVNAGLTLLCKYLKVPTEDLIKIALVDLAVYLTTLSTSILLYRVFFHPLNKYPGPILCKITKFVSTYHVMTRDSHEWMVDLHKKYGDTVRFSPNELSFISATSVDTIHGSKAGKLARGPFYSGDPNRPANSMLSTQDLGEHRWRRKMWERGFGSFQLKQFEPRVVRHLDVLVSQLNKRVGTPQNMTHWGEFFAYDVMSDLAFTEDFGMLREAKPHPYVAALHGGTRLLTIAAQTPWIRPLIPYFPVEAASKKAGKEFAKISSATYDRRRARHINEPDMFEYIASPDKTGPRPLTESEIIADTSLLIAAGAVSTALTVTFMFYHLCQNRSQLLRLQKEVDSCWDGKSVLDVAKLCKAAPYLNGCIEEILRLWPPAPNGMQRRTPPEGIVVDGEFVPGQTQISVHTLAVQRDPRHYTNPDDFIPERWIDEERPAKFNHDVRTFIPFTIGQFACLGKNLAYQELRMFMGAVVRNFDFKFAPGFDIKEFEKSIKYKGTFLIGPLMVEFTARPK